MGLWAKIVGFFRRKEQAPRSATRAPVVMNIPAPSTLVAKIDRLDDEDRDMLRVAEEALRRGFPEEARVAYWKALRLYVGEQQYLKAISVASTLLKLRPDDVDALVMRAECCVALDRRRDAARSYMEASALCEANGEPQRALDLLEPCLELDREVEGLRMRYLKLGGARDVWAPPRAAKSQSSPGLDPDRPESYPILPGVPPGLKSSTPIPPLATTSPAISSPAISAAIVRGTPMGSQDLPGDEQAIELELERDPEPKARPATRPAPSRPIRFAIPDQATVLEPNLPSAIVGTEHEAEASGDVNAYDLLANEDEPDTGEYAAGDPTEALEVPSSGIADAQTQAIDASSLSALIKKIKAG